MLGDQLNDRNKPWLGVLGSKPGFATKVTWPNHFFFMTKQQNTIKKQDCLGGLQTSVPFYFAESLWFSEVAWLGSGSCPWSKLLKTMTQKEEGTTINLTVFSWMVSCEDPYKWLPPTLKHLICQAMNRRVTPFKSTGKKMQVLSALQGHSQQQRHKANNTKS